MPDKGFPVKQKPYDHVKMMQSPGQWPLWPVLPLKQREGMKQPRLGVMHEAAFGVKPTVYLVDLYNLSKQPPGTSWDDIEHIDYLDFEGVVDAGWVVD